MILLRTIIVTLGLSIGVFQGSLCAQNVDDKQFDQQLHKFKSALVSGNPQLAMQISGEMQKAAPKHADSHTAIGIVTMLQKNLDLAKKHFETALKAEANHPVASAYLARILIIQQQVEDGEAMMKKALVAHPKAVDLLDLKAELLVRKGQVDESLACYKLIADNADNDKMLRVNVYMKIAQIYGMKKDTASVIRTLQSSLSLEWTPATAIALMQQYVAVKQPLKAHEIEKEIVKNADSPKFKTQREQILRAIDGPTVFNNFLLMEHYLAQEEYDDSKVSNLIYFSRLILDKIKTVESATKLKELDNLEFRHQYRFLQGLVDKEGSQDRIVSVAKKIIALAPSVTVKEKDTILAHANKLIAEGDDVAKRYAEVVLKLAKEGDYRLNDFSNPSMGSKVILEQHKLPASLPVATIETLQKYYTEIEKLRKVPAYKELVSQYVTNPNDIDVQKKLAAAYLSHIKEIDIKSDDATEEAIYPRRYWDHIPRHQNTPNGKVEYTERESRAYVTIEIGAQKYLAKNAKWNEAISCYNHTIAFFPLKEALVNRGTAQFHLKNYTAAAEDFATAAAIESWNRAERFAPSASAFNGSPIPHLAQTAKDLHLLATGDQSEEIKKIRNMLNAIDANQWDKLVEFTVAPRPAMGLTNIIHQQLQYSNSWSHPLRQHMGDRLLSIPVKDADAYYEKVKSMIYNSVAVELHAQHKIKTVDEKISSLLLDLNNSEYEGRSVRGHFEMGLLYLKKGEKQRAKLHFNVAAHGLSSSKLEGLAKKAAEQRDILEGKQSKEENFQMCLADDKFLISLPEEEKRTVVFAILRAELYTRMLIFTNQTNAIKYHRGIFYTSAKQARLANSDLLSVTPMKGNEGIYYSYLSQSYRDLGDFNSAIKNLELALKNGQKTSYVYHTLAALHCSMGDYKKAVTYQDEQIKQQPEQLLAIIHRSNILQYPLDNADAAEKDIDKALAIIKKEPKKANEMLNFRLLNRKQAIVIKRLDKLLGE